MRFLDGAAPRAAAAAVLLALNAALAFRIAGARAPALRPALDASYVETGEALRLAQHPRSVNPAYRMPVNTLTEAVAFSDLSPAALRAWAAILWACAVLLVFALARALGGTWAGLSAAAAWQALFLAAPFGTGIYKQLWLTAAAALAAAALARHARAPSSAGALSTGAAFGLTMLARGTYFLIPPLLAAAEFLRSGAPRVRAARAALLLLGAAALVAPWAAMNARVSGRPLPFEDGPMYMNVVTGALGTTRTAHGDYAALTDGEVRQGRSPLAWAVRRVAARPAPYLRAVGARVARAVSLQPLLFLLALAGLLLARRDAAVRALAAQAAYFVLIVCLMSVEDDHFAPLWPVLLALAGAPLARLRPPPGERAARLAAGAGLLLAAALGAGAALWSGSAALGYAAAYARREPWSERALDEVEAARPRPAWSTLALARRALGRDDPKTALALLEESAPRIGDLPRHRALTAWARARAGDDRALHALEPVLFPARDAHNDDGAELVLAYQALARARAGRDAAALRLMAAAADAWGARQGFITPGESGTAGLDAALRARAAETFPDRLVLLLGEEPGALRAALALSARARPSYAAWLASARAEKDADRRAAIAALARAEALADERAGRRRELQLLWAELGETTRALKLLDALVRAEPREPAHRTDRAILLYRRGDAAGAEKELRAALALDGGHAPSALTYAAVLGPGRAAEAAPACRAALARPPEDALMAARLRECAAQPSSTRAAAPR